MVSRPALPFEIPVLFVDLPEHGGLLLAYDEYRNLEKNIIELRRYCADLEATIQYYESALSPQTK